MKIELLLKIVVEVENSDGYPNEFEKLTTHPRSKRDRQVLAAFYREVQSAESVVIELLNNRGYEAETIKTGKLA
jgi:hypothetical protein